MTSATADDFCDKADDDETDGKEYEFLVHAAERCFESDTCKENRSENHIGADIHFFFDVIGRIEGTQDNARNVCTGNIGDAEIFFGNVGQSEAERKTQNRETAGVRKYGVHAVEQLKAEKTEHNRKGKKQNGGGCYFQRIGCRIFKTDDNSQHNDTNDIVDDGAFKMVVPTSVFSLPSSFKAVR